MAEEETESTSEEKPCSNPYGVAGDIHREEDGRRINIFKCSPYGNWVHIGSELKDQQSKPASARPPAGPNPLEPTRPPRHCEPKAKQSRRRWCPSPRSRHCERSEAIQQGPVHY